jgi:pimeloyl-ACP methyl ester carboxylesterase
MQNTEERRAAEEAAGGQAARGRLVRVADGEMYVVEAGDPAAPAVVLVHGTVVSAVCWEPVLPALAAGFRVIAVDLLGCGRSTAATAGGLDVPAQARRVGELLDLLGVRRVTAIGHSSGCLVATSLAEQRPDIVGALALIDMGPDLAAEYPENFVAGLIFTPVVGALLWRLRSESAVRAASRSGFTRPVEIPDVLVEHVMRVTRRDFVDMTRGSIGYLKERSLTDRITPLCLPLLVLFGAEDRRWRASSAEAYLAVPGARVELLPGVGHTPMMEDPDKTARLLLGFLESLRLKGAAHR